MNTSRSFSLQLTCSVKLTYFHCSCDDAQIQMCFKKFLWACIMHFNIHCVFWHQNKHFSLTSFPDNRDCSKINSIVMTQISNFNSFLLYTLCPSCPLTDICNQESKTKKATHICNVMQIMVPKEPWHKVGLATLNIAFFSTSNINFWHCWSVRIAQYILLSLC